MNVRNMLCVPSDEVSRHSAPGCSVRKWQVYVVMDYMVSDLVGYLANGSCEAFVGDFGNDGAKVTVGAGPKDVPADTISARRKQADTIERMCQLRPKCKAPQAVRLSVSFIKCIMQQILCGTSFLHRHGIFHRDLKRTFAVWTASCVRCCAAYMMVSSSTVMLPIPRADSADGMSYLHSCVCLAPFFLSFFFPLVSL